VRRLVTARARLRQERHQAADVLVRVDQLSLVRGMEVEAGESRHGKDLVTAEQLLIHDSLVSGEDARFVETIPPAQAWRSMPPTTLDALCDAIWRSA
jgi:hypothetical protein